MCLVFNKVHSCDIGEIKYSHGNSWELLFLLIPKSALVLWLGSAF